MEEIHQDKQSLSFLQRVYATSCDYLSNSAEYLASFSAGQSVLRQTDRFLWTIEKCAEWSVPTTPTSKQSNSNGTFGKPGPLVRPLPWLLFLPMLLFLRVIRFSLNIGAMLIGMETVKPSKIVRFIQVRRRRIRALKFLGLRRIRQKKMEKENQLTWKESFYNIMLRAMCFRVTNSDLYEQITVKKESQENEQSSKTKSKSNGKDLKRKYIEILKNNYFDWEDVEDDEELIDRITQLAEDDDNDSDFVPAEDSATEDDSMSDAEEDSPIPLASGSGASTSAATSVICNSSESSLQRLASQGSLSNATIEEENENEEENGDADGAADGDSDSTTVSANSEDESSQHMSAGETPKKEETPKKPDNLVVVQPSTDVTSDEYYSPVNSISTSPELKTDEELIKNTKQQNNKLEDEKKDDKKETENFINAETKQASASALTLTQNHNNSNSNSSMLPANKQPIIVHDRGYVKPNSNSNSHTSSSISTSTSTSTSSSTSFSPSPRGHGKKHKRRLSNLLRRKHK